MTAARLIMSPSIRLSGVRIIHPRLVASGIQMIVMNADVLLNSREPLGDDFASEVPIEEPRQNLTRRCG